MPAASRLSIGDVPLVTVFGRRVASFFEEEVRDDDGDNNRDEYDDPSRRMMTMSGQRMECFRWPEEEERPDEIESSSLLLGAIVPDSGNGPAAEEEEEEGRPPDRKWAAAAAAVKDEPPLISEDDRRPRSAFAVGGDGAAGIGRSGRSSGVGGEEPIRIGSFRGGGGDLSADVDERPPTPGGRADGGRRRSSSPSWDREGAAKMSAPAPPTLTRRPSPGAPFLFLGGVGGSGGERPNLLPRSALEATAANDPAGTTTSAGPTLTRYC